jgi:hypothetical protein
MYPVDVRQRRGYIIAKSSDQLWILWCWYSLKFSTRGLQIFDGGILEGLGTSAGGFGA